MASQALPGKTSNIKSVDMIEPEEILPSKKSHPISPKNRLTYRDLKLSVRGKEIVSYLKKEEDDFKDYDFTKDFDYEYSSKSITESTTTISEKDYDKKWLDYRGPNIHVLMDLDSEKWSGGDDAPVSKKKERLLPCLNPECSKRKIIYHPSKISTETESDFEIPENEKAFIRIYFGPYNVSGIVRHRAHRILGLRDRLRNEFGHRVQLVPSIHWNRVVISVGNYNIFRCNICNLDIETSNGKDVVASRAIEAVKEALQRIQPKYTYPKNYVLGMENSPVMNFYEEILYDILKQSLQKLEPRYVVEGILGSIISKVLREIKEEVPIYYQILRLLEEIVLKRMEDPYQYFSRILTKAMEQALAKIDPDFRTQSYSDLFKMILCATSRAVTARDNARSTMTNVMNDLISKVIKSPEPSNPSVSSTTQEMENNFDEGEEEESEECCSVDDSIHSLKSKNEEFKKPGSNDQFWPEPWYPIRKIGKFPSDISPFKKTKKVQKRKCRCKILARFLNSLAKQTLLKLPEKSS